MKQKPSHSTVYFPPGVKEIFDESICVTYGWCSNISRYFFAILALRLRDDVLTLPKHERFRASASIIHSICLFAAGKNPTARRIADRILEDPLSLYFKGSARAYIDEAFEQEIQAVSKSKGSGEESAEESGSSD